MGLLGAVGRSAVRHLVVGALTGGLGNAAMIPFDVMDAMDAAQGTAEIVRGSAQDGAEEYEQEQSAEEGYGEAGYGGAGYDEAAYGEPEYVQDYAGEDEDEDEEEVEEGGAYNTSTVYQQPHNYGYRSRPAYDDEFSGSFEEDYDDDEEEEEEEEEDDDDYSGYEHDEAYIEARNYPSYQQHPAANYYGYNYNLHTPHYNHHNYNPNYYGYNYNH